MKLDLFGIRKRKEAARIKEEQKFAIIKKEYQILKERAKAEAEVQNDAQRRYTNEFNDTCPHCKSKNVNDRIQRIQGSSSSFISGSLFGFSGRSGGKIDTNEINKCNDCGNEWKKRSSVYTYDKEVIYNFFNKLSYFCKNYNDAINTKVDKNDLDEKYNTNEEKRKDYLKLFKDHIYIDILTKFFNNISIETVEYLSKQPETWKVYYGNVEDNYNFKYFKENYNVKVLEEYLGLKHMNLINTSEI